MKYLKWSSCKNRIKICKHKLAELHLGPMPHGQPFTSTVDYVIKCVAIYSIFLRKWNTVRRYNTTKWLEWPNFQISVVEINNSWWGRYWFMSKGDASIVRIVHSGRQNFSDLSVTLEDRFKDGIFFVCVAYSISSVPSQSGQCPGEWAHLWRWAPVTFPHQ